MNGPKNWSIASVMCHQASVPGDGLRRFAGPKYGTSVEIKAVRRAFRKVQSKRSALHHMVGAQPRL